MATRDYQFIVGPQTSTIPTATSPTTSDDFMSLGYADANYTDLDDFGPSVASNAALKAVGTSSRPDGQTRLVEGTNTLWRFSSASSATDDGLTVLQPDTGTGRWLVVSSSAGGTSSSPATGLAIAELASAVEKNGVFKAAFSDMAMISEGFTAAGETSLTVSLGRDYTSGTTIYLDQDKVSIDQCDATTGFTAFGAQAGAATLDTTNKVESTGSVNTTVSATTVENGLYKDFTALSLVNRKLRISVRLSTISNISAIRVRLFNESGETNGKYWDKTLQSDGSALVADFNEIEVDPDDAATGSSGTFVQSSVVRIKVSVTPTSSQAFILNVDNIRHTDERAVPLYVTHQVYNSTVNESFKLTAYAGNKGTLSSGLSNAYSISSGVIRRSTSSVDPTLGTAEFRSGLAGTVAKTNNFHMRKTLDSSKAGSLKWSINFQTEPSYLVSTVTDSTHLKVSSAIDISAGFKSGNIIWAFRQVWNGTTYTLLNEPKRLTLAANSSYASSELTLQTSEVNTGVTANTDWYVIFEAAKMKAWVGSSTSSESLAASTPEELRWVNGTNNLYLSDNFNRSTTAPAVGTPSTIGAAWQNTVHTDTGTGGPTAKYNNAGGSEANFGVSQNANPFVWTYEVSNFTGVPYDGRNIDIKCKVKFHNDGSGDGFVSDQSWGFVLRNTSSSNGVSTGVFVGVFRSYSDAGPVSTSNVVIRDGGRSGTGVYSSSQAFTADTYYYFRILQENNRIRVKVWLATDTEPSSWGHDHYYGTATYSGRYWQLEHRSYVENATNMYASVDDLTVQAASGSYVLQGTLTSQSGDAIALSAELTREDTTNQLPKLNSINGYLG